MSYFNKSEHLTPMLYSKSFFNGLRIIVKQVSSEPLSDPVVVVRIERTRNGGKTFRYHKNCRKVGYGSGLALKVALHSETNQNCIGKERELKRLENYRWLGRERSAEPIIGCGENVAQVVFFPLSYLFQSTLNSMGAIKDSIKYFPSLSKRPKARR